MNADGHVTALLTKVITQRRALCYDSKERMADELHHHLEQYKNHSEMENFQFVLRGLGMLNREEVKVEQRSGLMTCIDNCVPKHTEESDEVIIYVACMSETLLVSNNDRHITNFSGCLKKCAKKHGKTSPEFWNSKTANNNL